MKFSVLMSLYHKEKAAFFEKAFDSIINQSLKPNEILIVEDGPLTPQLYESLQKYKLKYPDLLTTIKFEKNKGLGIALKHGVEKCKYEIIARMDTDDISKFDRFEKQITFLKNNENVDIIGSNISEFDNEESNIYSYRILPLKNESIKKFAKFRNPLNHMTVMFRKKAVLNAGNYKSLIGFEDYYLWVRMLLNNSTFANIPEILVNVRAGKNMISRRGGFKSISNFFLLEKTFYKLKFLKIHEVLRNLFLYSIIKIIPGWLRYQLYLIFLRE